MTEHQVHEAAHDVLRFWFAETPKELQFERDDALDAAIRARFGALRERIVREFSVEAMGSQTERALLDVRRKTRRIDTAVDGAIPSDHA